jgi:hypothetical protein
MAKYEAAPFYEIESGNVRVKFDFFGAYVTDNQDEIAVLDALCPTWIKRVDEPAKAKGPEPKTEEPAPAPKAPRKSSGK